MVDINVEAIIRNMGNCDAALGIRRDYDKTTLPKDLKELYKRQNPDRYEEAYYKLRNEK